MKLSWTYKTGTGQFNDFKSDCDLDGLVYDGQKIIPYHLKQ